MLRVSFAQIKDWDPLDIRNTYEPSDSFLDRFYTTCASVPITFILAVLFYSLWFISPKSQNLRIYQKDIQLWNTNNIASVMDNLEFQYTVTPAKDATVTNIVH